MEDDEFKFLQGGNLMRNEGDQNPRREEERKAREEEMKHHILSQVLSQEARSRLNTIRIAKPENGARLEALIISMARTGKLRTKLQDQEFVGLVEEVNEQLNAKPSVKVKFDRRRVNLDSDED